MCRVRRCCTCNAISGWTRCRGQGWERGATGVDLSDAAIGLARSLCGELNLDTRFICSNVYDLPDVLNEQFDVVFTSYGVLCWLPDLDGWASVVANHLKPGGVRSTS